MRVGPMLTQKMLTLDALGSETHPGAKGLGEHSHLCYCLQHHGVIHRLEGVFLPSERPMIPADDGEDVDGTDAPGPEGFHDHMSGVGFVVRTNLLPRQIPGAEDRFVEVVGMGGSVDGDIPARLGPAYGVGDVGMHDTVRPSTIAAGVPRDTSAPSTRAVMESTVSKTVGKVNTSSSKCTELHNKPCVWFIIHAYFSIPGLVVKEMVAFKSIARGVTFLHWVLSQAYPVDCYNNDIIVELTLKHQRVSFFIFEGQLIAEPSNLKL